MELTNKKTFKDFMTEDLDVFLNDTEFADYHEYEGDSILMVVVDDNYDDKKGIPRALDVASDGVFISTKTLHMKSDAVEKPAVGTKVTFDDENYYVEKSAIINGMLKIILTANDY